MGKGDITSVIDSLKLETVSTERWPKVLHLTDNIGICLYTGTPGDVYEKLLIKTFPITNDGTFGAVIDTLSASEYVTDEDACIVQVRDNWYIAFYMGAGNDGYCCTFQIDSSGNIDDATADTLEFDTTYAVNPRAIKLSEGYVALVYGGTYTMPGPVRWYHIKTFSVDALGNITEVDSWAQSESVVQPSHPIICTVNGDYRAIAYGRQTSAGQLKTIAISDTGAITKSWKGSYDLPVWLSRPSIVHIGGDVTAVCFNTPTTTTRVITISIDSNGNIGASPIDTQNISTLSPLCTPLTCIGGTIYAVMWEESGTWDGFISTVEIDATGAISLLDIEEFEAVNFHEARATIAAYATPIWVIAHDRAGCQLMSLGIEGSPLIVSTNPATEVGAVAATLNGTLGYDGGEVCQCGFEFGLDTGYGTTTPTESKTTGETFSQVIRGLEPMTTYHFRALATNSAGTAYGADRTLNTTPIISKAYALAREEM